VVVPAEALASALVNAIEAARPQKKNVANRTRKTPWTPKDGSPKLKLKRKVYQHGLEVSDKFSTNEEIELMNKLKPGVYCDGHVKVRQRRDKALDIDYPIKTNAQRLKLVSTYGVRNFKELLELLVGEATAASARGARASLDDE
jgi:hypothetical protein